MKVSDEVYVIAHTRLTNGELLLDELLGRCRFVDAAKKAKWDRPMVEMCEDRVLAVLEFVVREHGRMTNPEEAVREASR